MVDSTADQAFEKKRQEIQAKLEESKKERDAQNEAR